MKNQSIVYFVIVILLTGCVQVQQTLPTIIIATPNPTVTETIVEATHRALPSRSVSPTSTPIHPTPTVEPIWTLPPTLLPDEASLKIKELLENHRGCQLPCLWGISPGKTTWEDARDFLSPMAIWMHHEDAVFKVPAGAEVEMQFPAPFPVEGKFWQDCLVKEGVVQRIYIYPQEFSPYSTPKGLLSEFGIPNGSTKRLLVKWQKVYF